MSCIYVISIGQLKFCSQGHSITIMRTNEIRMFLIELEKSKPDLLKILRLKPELEDLSSNLVSPAPASWKSPQTLMILVS